jgi:hypothetical protein
MEPLSEDFGRITILLNNKGRRIRRRRHRRRRRRMRRQWKNNDSVEMGLSSLYVVIKIL